MNICNFCAKRNVNLKAICENVLLPDNTTIIIEDLLKIFPSDVVELFSFDINCSICQECLQQLGNCYAFVQQIKDAGVRLKRKVIIKEEIDDTSFIETVTIEKQETSNCNSTHRSHETYNDTVQFEEDDDHFGYNYKPIMPKTLLSANATYQKKTARSSNRKCHSRWYRCLECTHAFKSFKLLRAHEAGHFSSSSLSGVYTCKYCHLCFQEQSSLLDHQHKLHLHEQFVCCLCNDKGFASKGYLTRHINKVHEHSCLKYFCGECRELLILPTLESVQGHYKEVHSLKCTSNNGRNNEQEDPLNEEDMDLEMHEEFLDEFLLAHTNENSFQFSECWEALDLHLPDMLQGNGNNFHNNGEFTEAFPCPKCFEQFKNPQPLLKHLAEQHNMPVLICRTCRKAFPTIQDFKLHKIDKCVQDISVEPLTTPCPYCGKPFKSSMSLKQHLRIVHTQHKKHICQLCDKQFSTLDHLKKHVLSQHQNERKHICHICAKSFTQLCHLKQHLSIHTTGKTIQCTECPETFWRNVDMDRHRKKKH